MRRVFSICEDIEGDSYKELLKCLLVKCPTFHLVWIDSVTYEASAISIRMELGRWEIDRRRRSAWPGIRYSSSKPIATVIFYKTDPQQIEMLERPKSLFGWMAPKWPEDVGFYAEDRSCAFATVSHERGGWLFDVSVAAMLPASIGLAEETWIDKDFEIFDSPVEL